MRTGTRKMSKPLSPWARAALAGCNWFVNSQLIQKSPNWDANHGRYPYNVHVPTQTRVLGLGWTQARAVMCLLAAYEHTHNEDYLDCARRGIDYARMLQNMDRRFPLTYGGLHEETPHSPFSYPRDAIEVADAFLQWHRVTGDRDALYRAELFFDWLRRNALTSFPGFGFWVRGEVRFDNQPLKDRFQRPISCQMGCITILTHAYAATRKAVYKDWALKLADSVLRNYSAPDQGPLRESAGQRLSHHTSTDGVIYNDDGGSVGLLNAYKLSRDRRYLDAAIRAAEFFRTLRQPIPIFSGTGSVANFLIEVDHLTKRSTYRPTAEKLARLLLKLQVRSGRPLVGGAFRGEDEGGKWYHKGAANDDFVTTRVTAYSVMLLFKLDGAVWPRGYSTHF